MKRVAPFVLAAAALAAGCASEPDPWVATGALAADADAQATTMIARFAAPLDAECAPGPTPVIEVLEPGGLGQVTIGAAPEAVTDEEDPCFETVVPGAGVFYTATGTGFDRLTLREVGGGVRPDVIHTAEVRVR